MNLKKTMNSVARCTIDDTTSCNKYKEVEVTVSVTLSKTVKIKVNDYIIKEEGLDEDGQFYQELDFSECDLNRAVQEQVLLPQYYIKDWNVDDFECVIE